MRVKRRSGRERDVPGVVGVVVVDVGGRIHCRLDWTLAF